MLYYIIAYGMGGDIVCDRMKGLYTLGQDQE